MSISTTAEGRKVQSLTRQATIDTIAKDIKQLEQEIEDLIQENDRLAKEIVELSERIKSSR